MRITAIDAIPYALPFKEPYVTARGRLEQREMVLARVRTDEAVEGLGEAVPLALRGGASLEEIVDELTEASGVLVGTDVAELEREGGVLAQVVTAEVSCGGLSGPTLAALETGLLDLAGRVADTPVWRLLGAESARPVACNATLSAGPPSEVAKRAADWAERGFGAFKLKVGMQGDVEQVRAVRQTLDAGARIRIDANGAWSPRDAIATLRELQPLDIELVEQPCSTLEELARVREAVDIPVAADESVANADDARNAVHDGACDLATAKLSKVGGIAAAEMVAAELPTYLSSALDGPVGIAAAWHAAQALYTYGEDPGIAHGLATQELFAETIASFECELRGGELHLQDRPGLGVEIDEDSLERNRL